MIFITIMASAIAIAVYATVAFKIGFYVADKTEHTGFDIGFYIITMVIFIAMPIAILAQFLSK